MVSRFARWYEEHPLAGDAALAAVLLLAFALPADLSADTGAAADLAFSAALIACVPFRRLAPVAVFAAVSVICLAQLALLDHIVAGDAVALIALYTIAAYGPGIVVGAAATACTVAGAVLAAVRWDEQADRTSTLDVAASTAVSSLLAGALGAWRRSRRAASTRVTSPWCCATPTTWSSARQGGGFEVRAVIPAGRMAATGAATLALAALASILVIGQAA